MQGHENITVSDLCRIGDWATHGKHEENSLARVRLRASPHTVIYFDGNRLIFDNYITRRRFSGTTDTLLLLNCFRGWAYASAASNVLKEYSEKSILTSVQNLLRVGLLITEDSEQDRLEGMFSNEWLWPIPSRFYHFSSKLDEPFSTSEKIRYYYRKYLKGKPQPPIYKNYSKNRSIKLMRYTGPEAPLFETMRRRLTTRNFSGKPISLKHLSRIMFFSWGRLSTYHTREFGRLLHKASPSAGARHPIESYAIVNSVEGVEPGIYHYSVKDHSLELLKQGDFRERCVDFAAGQTWTKNSSVFFVMTAVVSRTAWKYRTARVYRALLLDVGHLSQSFLLVSTALGLGAFCIGIISDATIEKELGIDGINEIALFAVGVGHRARPTASSHFP